MTYGKKICNALKILRKRMAEANDIPYEISVCHHKGACPGTCPMCEKEANYIYWALIERKHKKRAVKIEGLMTEKELYKVFASGPKESEETKGCVGLRANQEEDIIGEMDNVQFLIRHTMRR